MSTREKLSCRQADSHLDRAFGAPPEDLAPEVREHVEECPRCAALFNWAGSAEPESGARPGFERGIASRLRQSLKPVRPLPSGKVLVARFLAIFVLLMGLFTAVLGIGGVHDMTLPQLAGSSAILGAAAAFLALSLSWQMVPGQYQRVGAPLLIAVFVAGFLTVVAAMFPWEAAPKVFGDSWRCTIEGLVMAVPVGLFLLLLASRGAPLSFPTLGASLGAVSGFLALIALQLSCRHQQAGHLLSRHVIVVVICVAAGYLFGKLADHLITRRPPF